MTYIQKSIQEIETNFPDLIDTSMLIKLGIFSSEDQALQHRKSGESLEYFRLSDGRILYPKKAVINWLKESIVESEFDAEKPEKEKIKIKIRRRLRNGKNKLIDTSCGISLKTKKFLDNAATIIYNELGIMLPRATIIRSIIEETSKSKEIDKNYWLRIIKHNITEYT